MHNLSQSDFLSLEIVENLQLKPAPKHLDEAFLTELYVNKGLSLRQISKKLGVSRNIVRKQLYSNYISIEKQGKKTIKESTLKMIFKFREEGMSYQKIANKLEELNILNRKNGKRWYSKTVRDLVAGCVVGLSLVGVVMLYL